MSAVGRGLSYTHGEMEDILDICQGLVLNDQRLRELEYITAYTPHATSAFKLDIMIVCLTRDQQSSDVRPPEKSRRACTGRAIRARAQGTSRTINIDSWQTQTTTYRQTELKT